MKRNNWYVENVDMENGDKKWGQAPILKKRTVPKKCCLTKNWTRPQKHEEGDNPQKILLKKKGTVPFRVFPLGLSPSILLRSFYLPGFDN
jgi:hypothetical protein